MRMISIYPVFYTLALISLFQFPILTWAQNQQSDTLLYPTSVNIILDGQWTPAAITNVNFTEALITDISSVLGPQRATAWPINSYLGDGTEPTSATPGPVTVILQAWGDNGTLLDRFLQKATWTNTQAYYTSAIEGNPAPASPFLTSSVRSENMTLKFTGEEWGDTEKILSAEISQRITNSIQAVEDPTATPAALTANIIGELGRGNRSLTANVSVSSTGIQSIMQLISPQTVYQSVLEYYEQQTGVNNATLKSVQNMAILPSQSEYRLRLQTTISGSWQLVLQSSKARVITELQRAFANALTLTRSRVVIGNVSTGEYPFNLNAIMYIIHRSNFNTNGVSTGIEEANLSTLIDIYRTSGGDPSVTPVVLNSNVVEVTQPEPFITTHDLLISGTLWSEVLRTAPLDQLNNALANDLTNTMPYSSTQVNILSLETGANNSLNAHVMVSQRNTVHIVSISVNSFFTLATSLAETGTIYNQYSGAPPTETPNPPANESNNATNTTPTSPQPAQPGPAPSEPSEAAVRTVVRRITKTNVTGNANNNIIHRVLLNFITTRATETIRVISSNQEPVSRGNACTSRCIGLSVIGGCLLLLSIIGFIVFCMWRVLARHVTPRKDDGDLVRIPAHQNPFIASTALPALDRTRSFTPSSMYSSNNFNNNTFYNNTRGELGPMYPPAPSPVPPFGARSAVTSAAAPESRMTSFMPPQPNSSVLRQGAVVIPSASGEKEFEIVVMPRDEFERSRGWQ